MSDGRYVYVSEWRLDAPPAAVWDALLDVESWPDWWLHVRRVQTLARGDRSGLGARRRIGWSSRLPYGFTLDVLCVESRPERLLRGRATGDLEGEGVWELAPDGAGTAVRYTWRLDVNTRWMRLAAPLMGPAFRWNHEGVMRAGRDGLHARLARESMLEDLREEVARPR